MSIFYVIGVVVVVIIVAGYLGVHIWTLVLDIRPSARRTIEAAVPPAPSPFDGIVTQTRRDERIQSCGESSTFARLNPKGLLFSEI
jgi:hypothetical protein